MGILKNLIRYTLNCKHETRTAPAWSLGTVVVFLDKTAIGLDKLAIGLDKAATIRAFLLKTVIEQVKIARHADESLMGNF